MKKIARRPASNKLSNGTEDVLLDRLRAGEDQAFEDLVTTQGPRLLNSARRLLGHEEDARDCVQETFARAFSALDGFEGRSSLGTWLYRILFNQCLMKLRKRQRQKEVVLEKLMPEFDIDNCRVEPLWQLPQSVDELVERKHVRDQVRAAIECLPEIASNVLLLRDIEELSTKETAGILEISENAAKVRLHRARAALKKLLEPLYGSQSAAADRE